MPNLQKSLLLQAVLFLNLVLASRFAIADEPKPVKLWRYNSVAWYQKSAEFQLATKQAYRLAKATLEEGLNDSDWTADIPQLEQGGFAEKKPAVILDIDETVLDNSAYQARLVVDSSPEKPAEFDQTKWTAWVKEEQALPIAGSLDFVLHARRRGASVFFVTNRTEDEKESTIRNLTKYGYPARADNVLCTSPQHPSDKTSRRALIAANHRIVLLIGDNMSDLCDGVKVNDQAQRNRVAEQRSEWLGSRWIILPNPMYGGWEDPLKQLADPKQALRTQRQSAD